MCQISCWWYRRRDNHEVGSCWFLCCCNLEKRYLVFLCSGKCDTTNLFKVQTLKVGNQLENSLLFYPLEQSCDIRGQTFDIHAAKKTTNHISKQRKWWSFTNLNFHESFFCNFEVKGLDEDPPLPISPLRRISCFFLLSGKDFFNGIEFFS